MVQPTTLPRGVLSILCVLTVIGMVGFLVTALLGFEEPHAPTLLAAAAMALAAPIAALVHLRLTRGLTDEEKRVWLKE